MPFDVSQILTALGSQVAQQVNTEHPHADKYVHLLGRLMAHAARWQAVSATGISCITRFRNPIGETMTCVEPAISGCVVCSQAVCLNHAMVSPRDGTAVCFSCVGQAQARAKKARAEQPPSPKSETGPSYASLRRKHLRVLGLQDPAENAEIHAAYKTLAFKHHPDRATASRKAASAKKLAKINVAYAWLTSNAKERAA